MKIGEEDVIIIEFILEKNENFFLNVKSVNDYPRCSLCSNPISQSPIFCEKCNYFFYC